VITSGYGVSLESKTQNLIQHPQKLFFEGALFTRKLRSLVSISLFYD
jgi:hypothetical protein